MGVGDHRQPSATPSAFCKPRHANCVVREMTFARAVGSILPLLTVILFITSITQISWYVCSSRNRNPFRRDRTPTCKQNKNTVIPKVHKDYQNVCRFLKQELPPSKSREILLSEEKKRTRKREMDDLSFPRSAQGDSLDNAATYFSAMIQSSLQYHCLQMSF